jgi:Nickel responsive protein SCO4226-like
VASLLTAMPRYVVERTFPDALRLPAGAGNREACLRIVERNTDERVTWIHSYVGEDGKKTFCVYDGPSPEAIRRSAARNDLPVDRITEVRVLDPYFLS